MARTVCSSTDHCLLSKREEPIPPLAPHSLGEVMQTCDPSPAEVDADRSVTSSTQQV